MPDWAERLHFIALEIQPDQINGQHQDQTQGEKNTPAAAAADRHTPLPQRSQAKQQKQGDHDYTQDLRSGRAHLVEPFFQAGRDDHERDETGKADEAKRQERQPVLRPISQPQVAPARVGSAQTPDPTVQAFAPRRHVADHHQTDDQVGQMAPTFTVVARFGGGPLTAPL